MQHSQHLKKQKSQSNEVSHTLQNKFIGNSNIERKFLENFKVCLDFPKKWFAIS